jgi:hypothetical protein
MTPCIVISPMVISFINSMLWMEVNVKESETHVSSGLNWWPWNWYEVIIVQVSITQLLSLISYDRNFILNFNTARLSALEASTCLVRFLKKLNKTKTRWGGNLYKSVACAIFESNYTATVKFCIEGFTHKPMK